MLPHRIPGRALFAPWTRALTWSLLPAMAACGGAKFGASPNAPALQTPAPTKVDKPLKRQNGDGIGETNTGTRGSDYGVDTGAGGGPGDPLGSGNGGLAGAAGTSAGRGVETGLSGTGAPPGTGPGGSNPGGGMTGANTGGTNVPVRPVVVGPRPSTPTQVKDACAGTRVKKPFSLEFASTTRAPGSICTWSSPPYIGKERQSNHIRGYHRQTASVDLPDNALVCSSNLRTKDSTLWEYDDEVVLTLNGVVVTTSQDALLFEDPSGRRAPRFEAQHGGYVWDWNRIFESNLANLGSTPDSIYCLGASSRLDCKLPLTQMEGAVKLSLGTDAVSALSLKALQDKKLEYALTVLGDNDPDLDCKHSGITIDGELEYVIVQQ